MSKISTIPAISLALMLIVKNSWGEPITSLVVAIAPENPLAVFLSKNWLGLPLVTWAIVTVVGLSELETEKSIGS